MQSLLSTPTSSPQEPFVQWSGAAVEIEVEAV
jgi:hypothetical protein